MEGVEGMRSVLRIFKPKGSIRVRIGRPFHLNVQGKLSRNDTEAAVSEIMGRIAVLLPESYRGDYKEAAEATFVFTSTNELSDD
jgi:hypothetical protein